MITSRALFLWAMLVLHIIFMPALLAKDEASAESKVESEQFGAVRHDFLVEGARAFIIIPEEAKENAPWVWYAPTFIGQHPDPSHEWMFKQFLEAGFYIGGIEIGESYGSPKGRGLYQDYYEYITKDYNLSHRATLMPQSRGGLMLYNWAAEHATSESCIAGIYTVCNLESYPGVEVAAPAYELTPASLKEKLTDHNPVSRLMPLVLSYVPIFHIHGDSDVVVPVEKNAMLLTETYRELGGSAVLKIIPDKGHEVCDEFFKDEELVNFVLTKGQ